MNKSEDIVSLCLPDEDCKGEAIAEAGVDWALAEAPMAAMVGVVRDCKAWLELQILNIQDRLGAQ